MKNAVFILLLVVSVGFGALQWRTAKGLRAMNESLLARLETARAEADAREEENASRHGAEIERMRGQLEEVHQLRGEVSQLRATAAEAARLRAAAERRQAPQLPPMPPLPTAAASQEPEPETPVALASFPKENWSFAGYGTPESALVSAIWAMQQGTPEAYLDSLAPDEQARMAQRWAGKTEEEIAAKHQSDVTPISGLSVTGRQEIDADTVIMDVQIEGVNRAEKVSMKRVDGQWKFNGYLRDEAQ